MTPVSFTTSALSGAKALAYLGLGVVFWFVAALYVSLLGPLMFDFGLLHLIAFAIAAAAAWVFIWTAARLTGTALSDMLVPSVVMLIAAMLLDGLAITYAPALYGGDGPVLALGGAQILWGAGWVLIVALWLARR